jgi:Protein of unknown function (DUF3305)
LTHPSPLVRIPVGVVVERCKATSPWIDYVWRPVAVLAGQPDAAPWTLLAEEMETTTFYAGAGSIELHRTDTAHYRDNLLTEAPLLWVALRPTGIEPPYEILTVTANPAEGEALTEPATDLVDTVPMPDPVRDAVAAFVAEHHVERVFIKRKRDRADPQAMARRGIIREGNE